MKERSELLGIFAQWMQENKLTASEIIVILECCVRELLGRDPVLGRKIFDLVREIDA